MYVFGDLGACPDGMTSQGGRCVPASTSALNITPGTGVETLPGYDWEMGTGPTQYVPWTSDKPTGPAYTKPTDTGGGSKPPSDGGTPPPTEEMTYGPIEPVEAPWYKKYKWALIGGGVFVAGITAFMVTRKPKSVEGF